MGKVKQFPRGGKKPLGITIGLGNHKGGVGKSTNAVHIASGLGEKGYRCLLIDLDPTAGTTKLLGVDAEEYAGTLELLTDEKETPRSLAIEDDLPRGVELIAARTELAELENLLGRYTDRVRLLDRPLKLAKKDYDYIIVDTPPQPGSSLLACAYASLDWFLLSVHGEPLALGGLSETLKDISDVRHQLNRRLEILGVVISRVKRGSNYWKEVSAYIDQALPGRGFSVQISDTVEVPRLSELGITAFEHSKLKRHKIVKEYRALVKEIEKRTLNREKFLKKTAPKTQSRKVANS